MVDLTLIWQLLQGPQHGVLLRLLTWSEAGGEEQEEAGRAAARPASPHFQAKLS